MRTSDSAAGSLQRPDRQAGQSLTEMLVVLATFLVPMFLIVPVLAQMISLKQDAETAARYTAWERTVWLAAPASYDSFVSRLGNTVVRSDAELANQVDHRIHSESAVQIYSSSSDTSYQVNPFDLVKDPQQAERVALMKTHGGSTTSEPKYSSQSSTDTAPPGSLSRVLGELLGTLGSITSFDLNQNGYVTSIYSVDLVRTPWLGEDFDIAALTYTTRNTLLTDSWNPTGRAHVESRITGLLPQAALPDDLMDVIQEGAALVPWFKELDSDSLILGQVNSDPVPSHRLSEYR